MCANLPPGVSWYDLEPKEHYAECGADRCPDCGSCEVSSANDYWTGAMPTMFCSDCDMYGDPGLFDSSEMVCICDEIKARDAERMAEYATE